MARPPRTRSSAKTASAQPTGTPTPERCHHHPLRGNERRPNGGNGPRRPGPPTRALFGGAAGRPTNGSGGATERWSWPGWTASSSTGSPTWTRRPARRDCAAAGLIGLVGTRRTRARGVAAVRRPRRGVSRAARRSPRAFYDRRVYDGRHEHVSQQHMAVPALWSAAAEDSLESMFHAMVAAGIDYRRVLSEVRDAFPELAQRDPSGGGRRPW